MKQSIEEFKVVLAHHRAEAILKHDMSTAVGELETVLLDIAIPVEGLLYAGSGERELTQRLRIALVDTHGWKKQMFEVKKIVDGKENDSLSQTLWGGTLARA